MPRAPDQHMYTPGGCGVSHSKLQSPMTIQWLNENYEVSEGVSLPRSALYSHYLDFCEKNNLAPVNAASFGKIIRHNFPNLKTRRLGTRGQSKYHYYGITIKTTSPYHDTVVNAARQSSSGFSQTYSKIETDERVHTHTLAKSSQGSNSSPLSSSGGTLLPDFPSATQLKLPEDVESEKAKTFLIMYRAHCQRVLDTILRANFGEVQNFLIHFWQGMPSHMLEILECNEVIDLIGVCDNILYKAISGVLIPGTLQPLPASLTQAIRQFAKQIGPWLESSLAHLPAQLQERKLTVAKVFSHSLRRQTSLTHLAQAARTVLHSTESVQQMLSDWRNIDFESIAHQALWAFGEPQDEDRLRIKLFHQEFTQLLDQQATIDQYAEWASTLVDRCVTKLAESTNQPVKECAQNFLLKWSFFSTKIVRELTLHSAHSFGSFHLLHMLLEDYILYVVEQQNNPEEQLALKIYPKQLRLEVHDATHDELEPVEEERKARPYCDKKMKSRRLGSSSGALLSPTEHSSKNSVPVIRSPSFRDISPRPLVSPTNNNNVMKTSQQDRGHFIYPPTPELSPRYSSYANASYNHSNGGYSPLYSSNGNSTIPTLTDLDMTRNYGMDRYSSQTSSSFSSPRPKANLNGGSYAYGSTASSLPYDYRGLPAMDSMKYYSQYTLPERNYQSSYMLSPSVMTASNLYGYPRTDVVSGTSNDRYYPDGLEEFVDVQAPMHHGAAGRSIRNDYSYSPAILTS